MENVVNVGLLGFGTVGSGTARILLEKCDLLSERIGRKVRLKWICDLDITSSRGFPVPAEILTTDLNDLLDDPETHIFVELVGGFEPAKSFILQAIEKGKHIVTANKALLAVHGHEIFSAAAAKGVEVGFEASVGGGIPVIKGLKEGLAANSLSTVMGIMNGTANYILTQMTDKGIPFAQALSEAQELGYAEADPTYDVEGIDTAHKLAIMAMLAFGAPLSLDDVYVEGMSRITPLDIRFAKELGYRIKLLAIGRDSNKGIELRVHPTMVPADHLLGSINGAYNAFYLIGDAVGKVLFYGLGAGQMPTGSAVVADVVDIARNMTHNASLRVAPLGVPFTNLQLKEKMPFEEITGRYYFRFSALDKPGVLASIAGILGEMDISIESVVQYGREKDASVPIVMLTHESKEALVRKALARIDNLDIVSEETMVIRIEDMKDIERD